MAAAPPNPMPAGTPTPGFAGAGLAPAQTVQQPAAAAPPPAMPVPAASPNQLGAFGSAQATTDAQRQALLAAVAESGAAGAQQYAQAQAQQGTAQEQAVRNALQMAQQSPLSVITGGYNVVTDPVNADFARMGADLDAGRQAFSQDIARQTAAGQQYMGQLSQAIPLVEARTRAQAQQIAEQARQEAADRAMRMAMGQMEMQSARERQQFDRESMAWERQQQLIANKTGGRDPLETALMQQQLDMGNQQLTNDREDRETARQNTAFDSVVTRYATGEHAAGRAQAIEAIVNAGEGEEMVLAMRNVFQNAGQYGITPDDQHAIMDAVNAYRSQAGMEGSLSFSDPGNQSRAPRSRNRRQETTSTTDRAGRDLTG